MGLIERSTLCPVCGYDLAFEPWDRNSSSDEYCPSCGIQFGYHDVPEASGIRGSRDEIYSEWRAKWIANGMNWSIPEISQPPHWNPREQLKRIGVKL